MAKTLSEDLRVRVIAAVEGGLSATPQPPALGSRWPLQSAGCERGE